MTTSDDGREHRRSSSTITSACPKCKDVQKREIYDIGTGPEVACDRCSWCWDVGGRRMPDIPTLELRDYLARVHSGSYFHDGG